MSDIDDPFDDVVASKVGTRDRAASPGARPHWASSRRASRPARSCSTSSGRGCGSTSSTGPGPRPRACTPRIRRRTSPRSCAPSDLVGAYAGIVALGLVPLPRGRAAEPTGQVDRGPARAPLPPPSGSTRLLRPAPAGQLVTRVMTDVENLNDVHVGPDRAPFDFVKVVFLGVLFTLDLHLALVVLAGTPFLIGTSLVFRGARRAHRAARASRGSTGTSRRCSRGSASSRCSGARTASRRVGRLSSYLDANRRTAFLFALFFPAIDLVVSAIQGSTPGRRRIDRGSHSPGGEFIQLWLYLALSSRRSASSRALQHPPERLRFRRACSTSRHPAEARAALSRRRSRA